LKKAHVIHVIEHCTLNIDGIVKSQKVPFSVIPAKAGIQENQGVLDPGSPTSTFGDRLRRGDGSGDFLRVYQRTNNEYSMYSGPNHSCPKSGKMLFGSKLFQKVREGIYRFEFSG